MRLGIILNSFRACAPDHACILKRMGALVFILAFLCGLPASAQEEDETPVYDTASSRGGTYFRLGDQAEAWQVDSLQNTEAMTQLAQNDLWKGHYFDAIQKAMRALDMTRTDISGERFIAVAYNVLGTSYSRLGNLVLAVHNYLNAASFKQKIPESPVALSDIYNNMGTVMPDERQAMQYFDMAYKAAESEGNKRIMAMALQNKSLFFEKRGDYEAADKAISESYKIGKKIEDTVLMYVANMRWCNSYLNRSNFPEAMRYMATADSFMAQMRPQPYEQTLHMHMKGQVYLAQDDYRTAAHYFLEALAITRAHDDIIREILVCRSLAGVYEKLKDPSAALAFHKKYVSLKDSVLNETISQGVSSLEVQYRIHEKDKELEIKERQVQKRNYLIAGISGSIFLLGATFYFFYRQTRQRQRMLRQEREITQLKATMKGEEHERVRIARELHDGIMVQFSSVRMNLNTVSENPEAHSLKEELNEILNHLDDATRELRRSAHNLMPDMLMAEGLSGAIQYFCTSISQRSGVQICFQQHGEMPAINATYELMLYRIVQELVQNAMKYSGGTRILVQLDTTDDLLTITVEDNGRGMPDLSNNLSAGTGLRGIHERIKALRGTMEVNSAKDLGTTVYIELEIAILQEENHTEHAYIRSHS